MMPISLSLSLLYHTKVIENMALNQFMSNIEKVIYKDGTSKLVRNPSDFPDMDERSLRVSKFQEPMVLATLIFPDVSPHYVVDAYIK
jgi:translation elongation factor EF-4